MDINELAQLLGYSGLVTGAPTPTAPVPTPVDPGLGPDPGLAPEPERPASSPSGSAPPPLPPGIGKVSVGSATGNQGFSSAKNAQVKKATSGEDRIISGAYGRAEARSQPELDAIARQGEEQRVAQEAASKAEQAQIAEKARHASELSGLQGKFKIEEQEAYADANAAAEAAKQEYHAKLLEIPTLNPSQLWDAAGAQGQFGMAAAAFLHDFLGAKGIKTSAMDSINGAITRNIDSQIANINNKRQVAAGFKDLWEMTRAQSASATEARARMHSYALASLQAELDSRMGSYDSNLAAAKHQMAKALISKEINNQIFTVQKHIDESAAQEAGRLVTMRGQNLEASIAKANQENQLAIARIQADARTKEKTGPRFVFDPETGRGKFVFKEGIGKEQENKILEQVGKFEPANITMNKLRELERKAGTQVPDPVKGTRFSTEQQREFSALATQLAHELVAARGERPTDKDVEQQLKALPQNTTFTVGGTSRILAGTQMGLNNAVHGIIRQFVDDVPENQQPQGVTGRLAQTSFTDASIINKGEPPEVRSTDKFEKLLGRPDAFAATDEGSKADVADWQRFAKSHNIEITQEAAKRRLGKAQDNPIEATYSAVDLAKPDKVFLSIRELAELATKQDAAAYAKLSELASQEGPAYEVPAVGGASGQTGVGHAKLSEESQLIKDYAVWEKSIVDQRLRK